MVACIRHMQLRNREHDGVKAKSLQHTQKDFDIYTMCKRLCPSLLPIHHGNIRIDNPVRAS